MEQLKWQDIWGDSRTENQDKHLEEKERKVRGSLSKEGRIVRERKQRKDTVRPRSGIKSLPSDINLSVEGRAATSSAPSLSHAQSQHHNDNKAERKSLGLRNGGKPRKTQRPLQVVEKSPKKNVSKLKDNLAADVNAEPRDKVRVNFLTKQYARFNNDNNNKDGDDDESGTNAVDLRTIVAAMKSKKVLSKVSRAEADRDRHHQHLSEMIRRVEEERERERENVANRERCVNDDESDEAEVVDEDEELLRSAVSSVFYMRGDQARRRGSNMKKRGSSRSSAVIALCPNCSQLYHLRDQQDVIRQQRARTPNQMTSVKTIYEEADNDDAKNDDVDDDREGDDDVEGEDDFEDTQDMGSESGDGDDKINDEEESDDDDDDDVVYGDGDVMVKSSIRPNSTQWQTADSDNDDDHVMSPPALKDSGDDGDARYWRVINDDSSSDGGGDDVAGVGREREEAAGRGRNSRYH